MAGKLKFRRNNGNLADWQVPWREATQGIVQSIRIYGNIVAKECANDIRESAIDNLGGAKRTGHLANSGFVMRDDKSRSDLLAYKVYFDTTHGNLGSAGEMETRNFNYAVIVNEDLYPNHHKGNTYTEKKTHSGAKFFNKALESNLIPSMSKIRNALSVALKKGLI